MMQAVSENRLSVLDVNFANQMYECLDCRACEAVCPSGVRYGEVVEAARSQVELARSRVGDQNLRERLLRFAVFRLLLGNMRLLRLVASALRVYQRGGLSTLLRQTGLLRVLGLDRLERQAPRVSDRFFVPRDQVLEARGECRGIAALHTGCVMHVAFAEVDRATVRVLLQNGWDVALPAAQGCCGALHVHAGEHDAGRARARATIAGFEATDAEVIVSNAAGCGAALKDYGTLLHDDPQWAERAAVFSAKVRDVTELLAGAPLRGHLHPLNRTVTYQAPCHLLHAQRINDAPRKLLQSIPGLELVEMQENQLCCGSAGIYNITHPEMSARLLTNRIDQVDASHADTVATANPGCMLQLANGLEAGGTHVAVRHIVELLDESYRVGRGSDGSS
jgi:glycolate oxidase iron-sulfur subunit